MKGTATRSGYAVAALVALATGIVYLAALRNNFVDWDDDAYIFENPYIRSLDVRLVRWAFFHFYASNWHPLTWISHALDYAVWGLNPVGHHLTNIILHALNAFLAVLVLLRIAEAAAGKAGEGRGAFPLSERPLLIAAGAAGLVFGLHPIQVESVAWVSERKNLLCVFFFFLSLIAYARAVQAEDRTVVHPALRFFNRKYASSLALFVLALLSKPMAVTLPVVLILLDWYPFRRIQSLAALRVALVEKLPFFALAAASSIITILGQKTGGALQSFDTLPIQKRILVAFHSLLLYLGKILAPLNLIPYYPYPKQIGLSLEYLLSIALVVGMTLLLLVLARRQKLWLMLWLCFVVTLLPVLGIIQVGRQAMADRYAYLPLLAPLVAVGLAAAWIWERAAEQKNRHLKTLCIAAACAIVILLSSLTVKQIAVWNNSFSLWTSVIEKEPETVMAYTYRGAAFEKAGRLAEALSDYESAIRLNPADAIPYNYLGTVYGKLNSFARAIECFNRAVALAPGYADAYFNRGFTYTRAGQFERALEDFNKTLVLNSNDASVYMERGNLYRTIGNPSLAARDFQTACDLGYERACRALR